MRLSTLFAPLLLATLVAGCGKGGDDAPSDGAPEAQEEAPAAETGPAPAPAAQPAAQPATAPLSVADIDRWDRGMDAELKGVREAGEKLKSARTGQDTLSAMMASNDMSTRAAGASAAGVDEERYQFIRSTLSNAVGQLTPLEQEMDVSQMPPSAVEEMKKAREAGVARLSAEIPADVLAALRPRASELRKKDLALTAERLRAAGAAR